ncbi:MAG TPA: 16S rRNA (guanine(527)-N(7))-methyltransferase RsmG [Gammaproteobacteria bacterium]
MTPAQALARGLERLGLVLDAGQQSALLHYAELLARWNRVYNLTAVSDPHGIVTRHLLDALAVLPHLRGHRLVDVGTGAGLPGLPLAIARPGLQVTLLDASAKRIRFVQQALLELRLDHAVAVRSRVEAYRPEPRHDCVIARAFAGLSDMLPLCRHLVTDDGEILAMQGHWPAGGPADLPAGFRLVEVIPLAVPGLVAERHLVRVVADAGAATR